MSSKFRIAIDFSQLDSINPASGQYRYVIDLVRGLARLRPNMDFLLLGSRSDPVRELRPVFQEYADRWKYRKLARRQFRGSDYLNHWRYSLMLMRERINLLHSLHTFVPVLAPCPVVITLYDLMYELFDEYEEARRSRTYRIHKWGVKHQVERILCISKATAQDLKHRWGISEDKIDVVPLGSDFAETAIPRDVRSQFLRRSESGPVLLSPFNLEPRKNLYALLEATALLSSSHPELKLILFGNAAVTPAREADFERRVRELGIGENIVRTGVITDQQLALLYRAATLFVFPSLYEGFGLPLLEAMSAGACVLARNTSAMAEVVGEAGVLVETGEPQVLANAVAGLLENPDRRGFLGRLAEERAAVFSVERMASLTYESYLAALNVKPIDSRVPVDGYTG